jgi:hypothetical protein
MHESMSDQKDSQIHNVLYIQVTFFRAGRYNMSSTSPRE